MKNELAKRDETPEAAVEIMSTRAAQEVQAAMVMAKKFPRDQERAYERIMFACKRRGLAECSTYQYPRGATRITGPSIRLAEAVALCWGNLDYGVMELEQRGGESTVMSYCWDTETNTRQTKIFTVKHERKSRGRIEILTDPRDIYEMTANQGARRLRACILGIIPGDIIDDAVAQCEKTLMSGEKEPLADRVKKMLAIYKSEFKVTREMIEKKIGYNIESFNEKDMLTMKQIYQSLRDGMSDIADWFETAKDESPLEKKPVKIKEQPKPVVATPETAEISDLPRNTGLYAEIKQKLSASPVSILEVETMFRNNKQLEEDQSLENDLELCRYVHDNLISIINKILDERDAGSDGGLL